MDLLALRHTGELGTKATSLRIMAQDKAEQLLQKSQPGDTIHKIPACFCMDAPGIFELVNAQLELGEYVTVP